MLARLRSEIAYAGGIVRALKRTRPIAENRNLTLGDYLERWAKTFGDRPALLSETEALSFIYESDNSPRNSRAVVSLNTGWINKYVAPTRGDQLVC